MYNDGTTLPGGTAMLQTTHSDDPHVQEKIDKMAKRDRKIERFSAGR